MKAQANLQFASGVDLHRAEARVQSMPGVRAVTQVFPDDADEDLSRWYVVELEASSQARVLDALRSLDVVENVELAAPKGIRSPQNATRRAFPRTHH